MSSYAIRCIPCMYLSYIQVQVLSMSTFILFWLMITSLMIILLEVCSFHRKISSSKVFFISRSQLLYVNFREKIKIVFVQTWNGCRLALYTLTVLHTIVVTLLQGNAEHRQQGLVVNIAQWNFKNGKRVFVLVQDPRLMQIPLLPFFKSFQIFP